jgi:hypothetical protein
MYLVEGEFSNKKFLKIGITQRTVKIRFSRDSKYNIKEIASRTLTLYEAFQLEQEILKKYNSYRVRLDDEFDGKTECLCYSKQIIVDIVLDYF